MLKQWRAAGQAEAEVEEAPVCTRWVLACSCRLVAPWEAEAEAWVAQDSRSSSSLQDPSKDGEVAINHESRRPNKLSMSKLRNARTKTISLTCFSGAFNKVQQMVELPNETWSGSSRNFASNAAEVAL